MEEVNHESVARRWSPASALRFRPSTCLFAVLLLLSCYPQAQTPRPTESQVKAAYLYNFGKFVSWQSDQAASRTGFGICILGKDPFGAVLDSTVAGESIGGRAITVERLSRIQDAAGCSELYISPSEETRLGAILSAMQRVDVLTVSDIPNFAARGGMIGLVKQQDRIRFEVNRKVVEQHRLTLSSELLKVAARVIETGRAENQ